MKSLAKILCVTVTLLWPLLAGAEKTPAQGGDSKQCGNDMADELAQHLRALKISLKDGTGEFNSNKDGQVYLLISREKVNVNIPGPVKKRVVSAISYRTPAKDSGFYLVQAEFQRDSIIYTLERDSKILSSLAVRILKPEIAVGPQPPGDPFCDLVNAQNQTLFAALRQQANQTCTVTGACYQGCSNGQMNGMFTMVFFIPNNFMCAISTGGTSPQLKNAFNTSIERDANSFVFKGGK